MRGIFLSLGFPGETQGLPLERGAAHSCVSSVLEKERTLGRSILLTLSLHFGILF